MVDNRTYPGNKVDVINAGVRGIDTVGEYNLLKDKLLPMRPDIVILGIFMSNDINFNLAHKEHVEKVEYRAPWIATARQRFALAHFLYSRLLALNSRHKLFSASYLEQRTLIPREVRLVDRNGYHMLNYPVGETATYVVPPSPLILRAFDILDDLMGKLVELARKHQFQFKVILVPSPSTVAGELKLLHFVPDVNRPLRDLGIQVKPNMLDFMAPTRRVKEICRRRRIPLIDPTPRLKKIGLKVFFERDEHLTIIGHSAMATTLLEHRAHVVGAEEGGP